MTLKTIDRLDEKLQDETKKEPAKRWRNRYFDPNKMTKGELLIFVPSIFSVGEDGSFMGLVWPTKDTAETKADHFIKWTGEILKQYSLQPFVWDAAYEVDE